MHTLIPHTHSTHIISHLYRYANGPYIDLIQKAYSPNHPVLRHTDYSGQVCMGIVCMCVWVCMGVCIYMCVWVGVCVYIYIYTHVYMGIGYILYVYLSIYLSIYMYPLTLNYLSLPLHLPPYPPDPNCIGIIQANRIPLGVTSGANIP